MSIKRPRRNWRSSGRTIRGDRTGLTSPTSTFNPNEGDYMVTSTKDILLGTTDYRDLHLARFIEDNINNGISTITEKLCVRGNHKRVISFIKENYADSLMFSFGSSRIVITLEDDESVAYAIMEIESNANTIDFRFHSTFKINTILRERVLRDFDEISVYINWIYDSNMNRATVPIDLSLLPIDEMYSFLDGETLESYYQRFMASNAGILILIGPPGTGKTSFIRGFLASTESSAIVTYDEKIISEDGLFAEFIESNSNTLILEDADLFLSSRKDGNGLMTKFLNVGDGLVTIKGKKIIFSTNLPSVKDIDEALLRPGRCFDILHFDELSTIAANRLVDKLGITHTLQDKPTHAISEIFSGIRNSEHKQPKTTFGFC